MRRRTRGASRDASRGVSRGPTLHVMSGPTVPTAHSSLGATDVKLCSADRVGSWVYFLAVVACGPKKVFRFELPLRQKITGQARDEVKKCWSAYKRLSLERQANGLPELPFSTTSTYVLSGTVLGEDRSPDFDIPTTVLADASLVRLSPGARLEIPLSGTEDVMTDRDIKKSDEGSLP